MAASVFTSNNESYENEGTALLQYLRKVIDPLDIDGHDLSIVLPLNLIDPLAVRCLAGIIVDSGAVSTTIFVLSQDKAIIWSENLKKWLYSSPCDYFTNILLIMSRICVLIIDELNKMLVNVSYNNNLKYERERVCNRLELFELVKTQGDRFTNEVVTRLIDELVIQDQVEVERVMRDFNTTTEWLPLPGTMAVNLRTRMVCERTKKLKTMREAALPFTWKADQSDQINFSWAPTLIQQIAATDPNIKEEDILDALFRCLLGNNVEQTLLSVFGPGNNANVGLLNLILKSIVGEIEHKGNLGEEYCQSEFLQGMFNYIIVQGGSRYYEEQHPPAGVLHLPAEEQKLLPPHPFPRVPFHHIIGWFNAVTTVDLHAKVCVNTLHRLYMEQNGLTIERNDFLLLIKEWIPGAKDNIKRTSVNGINNQYVIRGWRMNEALSFVGEIRIMSLAEWFRATYVNECDSYPFLNDVRLDYLNYLSSLGLPVGSEKEFSTKLLQSFPDLTIKKKQCKINGVSSTKMRLWGWKRREANLLV